MVGPRFKKINNKELMISVQAKKLFQAIYYDKKNKEKRSDDVSYIKVSALISKMAFFYEKVRNAVDYEEDHLLRKNAIERILKRQIVIEGVLKTSKSEEISLHLLTELIRAGYLQNNAIPEIKIKEVAVLLEKYIKLKNICLERVSNFSDTENNPKVVKGKIQERNQLTSWVISLAATEIEENLGYKFIQKVVVQNMYKDLEKNIIANNNLSEIYKKNLKIQIYLSIFRKHVKYNDSMLSLILFRYYNKSWTKDEIEDKEIHDIADNIFKIQAAIKKQLKHPLAKQIDKITKKYSIFYQILAELAEKDPIKTYNEAKNDSNSYYQQIKKIYNKRYGEMKLKLWRSALRSILYIFLTKSIFVILIEIPAIKIFGEELSYVSLGINILFPALLLFFIVLITRKPSKKNLELVVEGIREVTYTDYERKLPYEIKQSVKRNKIVNFIYNIIYIATFLFTTYLVIKLLGFINFTWVSIVIFLFFLTFVSFFSVRIKRSLKEFTIEEKKDNLIDFLLDFFFMPIVAIGRWLSDKASKVNIFVFILDFVIEAPFKIFVEIAEDWTKYVKERKEDIM
jgi:uncharacterized membrane protein YhdT